MRRGIWEVMQVCFLIVALIAMIYATITSYKTAKTLKEVYENYYGAYDDYYDDDILSDESGIIGYYIMRHNASRDYSVDITEDNTEIICSEIFRFKYGDKPFTPKFVSTPVEYIVYNTTFDIVVKCRVYNWALENARCTLTANGDIIPEIKDVEMNKEVISTSDKKFIWINFYLDNNGKGYIIQENGKFYGIDIKFEY